MASNTSAPPPTTNSVQTSKPKTVNPETGMEEDAESEDPGSLKVLFIVVGDRNGYLNILQVRTVRYNFCLNEEKRVFKDNN